MTNKPMLSVERGLLESCWAALMQKGQVVKALELRALLDKPVDPPYPRVEIVKAHKHTCSCVVGDSGVCDCGAIVNGVAVKVEPAAQHQGEPVFMKPQYSSLPGLKIVCEEGEIGAEAFYRAPVDQSAPVAVVMPERRDLSLIKGPGYWEGQYDGWNACLAEVARLNGVKP